MNDIYMFLQIMNRGIEIFSSKNFGILFYDFMSDCSMFLNRHLYQVLDRKMCMSKFINQIKSILAYFFAYLQLMF